MAKALDTGILTLTPAVCNLIGANNIHMRTVRVEHDYKGEDAYALWYTLNAVMVHRGVLLDEHFDGSIEGIAPNSSIAALKLLALVL